MREKSVSKEEIQEKLHFNLKKLLIVTDANSSRRVIKKSQIDYKNSKTGKNGIDDGVNEETIEIDDEELDSSLIESRNKAKTEENLKVQISKRNTLLVIVVIVLAALVVVGAIIAIVYTKKPAVEVKQDLEEVHTPSQEEVDEKIGQLRKAFLANFDSSKKSSLLLPFFARSFRNDSVKSKSPESDALFVESKIAALLESDNTIDLPQKNLNRSLTSSESTENLENNESQPEAARTESMKDLIEKIII
jgi:hypothetical protein